MYLTITNWLLFMVFVASSVKNLFLYFAIKPKKQKQKISFWLLLFCLLMLFNVNLLFYVSHIFNQFYFCLWTLHIDISLFNVLEFLPSQICHLFFIFGLKTIVIKGFIISNMIKICPYSFLVCIAYSFLVLINKE